MWAAPENQCLRKVSFRLAVRPGCAAEAELMREMQAFHTPLISAFSAADSRKFSGGRACVQDSDLQEFFYREPPADQVNLPLCDGGPALSGAVVFSALKRAERGRGWVLRFYNPSDEAAEATVAFSRPVSSLVTANLKEEPEEGAVNGDLMAGAKKIVTLRFE